MSKNYIFSSESVGEGHPDKVCDTISDAVLDACLAQDQYSRVACETYAKSNLVVVGGEITTKATLDYNAIARQAIRDIGYTHDDDVFHADRVLILNAITAQSPDIAQGVDARAAEGKKTAEQGAGDQGLMFGYATNETPELMPAPIMYAHQLGRELTRARKAGVVKWLRPDAKSQVSVQYVNDQPLRITHVVVSTQHSADVKHKTIVDSYGGMGRHGGGAFSGKDPSKVDRSAAYMGRYVAKNIVAAGLATSAEIQFAYAIGHPDPVSVCVNTFGTGIVSDEEIESAVCEVFSFKPAAIIKQLNLLRPIYSKTTNYGHFGKIDPDITWEKADKVEALRKAASKTKLDGAAVRLKKSAALANGPPGSRAAARPQLIA